MKFKDIFSKGIALVMAAFAMAGLSACNGLMYDEQGDCDPHYKVKFEYRYHLQGKNGKYADSFAGEVEAVTLYLVDTQGNVVWQKSESGERLAADGYMMDVDINPGEYSLVAWCGTGVGTHFTVNDTKVASDLHCYMSRERGEDGRAQSKERLNPLFHGRLDNQVFPEEEGTHVYTVQLMKDTNNINIMLQHLSGEPIDPSMFEFTITDRNGWLDCFNNRIDDEEVDYGSHYLQALVGGSNNVGNSNIDITSNGGGLLSGHTTSRLEATGRAANNIPNDGDMWLTVKRVSGAPDASKAPMLSRSGNDSQESKVVLHVPLTSYCLRFKDVSYPEMSDQEFLDRCDTYNMVFLLDEGYRWVEMSLYIQSFKVVWQNAAL
ncbi:MAG: FimB/Mfa2 family fimbrial subunit [Muribaculum sp.]|nr:FimB/Mfa2 family fimbrial subunit [Muribaculaceae bacterium]MCM1081736.1 FimB/Mfa2 family fimbrial subunit [Muribaculum sp.]